MAKGKRILICVPSCDKEDDWHMDKAKAMGFPPKRILTKSVDLRQTWWKIGNPGTTGACVAWAAVDSLLRYSNQFC